MSGNVVLTSILALNASCRVTDGSQARRNRILRDRVVDVPCPPFYA